MRSAALAMTLAWLACTGGENQDANPAEAPTAAESLDVESDVGPVKASMSLSPKAPRIGDVLTLTFRVEAKPGVRIQLPPFGEALGRFTVLKFKPRRETSTDGAVVETQIYTLQAPGSGKQRIPSQRVEYWNKGDSAPQELLTDELAVTIESAVAGAELSSDLSTPPDKLDTVPGLPWWTWPLVGLIIVPLALLLATMRRSKRIAAARRAQLSAYDRARRRLNALEARGLPAPEEADAWYVELSGIVRRYLEDRLQIRAPELTTEEFLASARNHSNLEESVRDGLSQFLSACDRVKFAAHQPTTDESRNALQLAEELLDNQEQFLRRRDAPPDVEDEAA